MRVESPFPADGEAFEPVERGEGLLDDVAELAGADDVGLAPAGDDGQDVDALVISAVRAASFLAAASLPVDGGGTPH